MEFNKLVLEVNEDGICLLKINDPKRLNALSVEIYKELSDAIDYIAKEDSIKAVIVTGEGKAFVAGADIVAMSTAGPTEGMAFAAVGLANLRKMENIPKVFIAAINGFAFGGGCELALGCDIRIASTSAVMGLPEVGLGILPGNGGTQRLPRLIGQGKALELIMTAGQVKADEALRIGLVNQVVEPEELMDTAYKMAKKVLKNGPVSTGYAKLCVTKGSEVDIDRAMDIEKQYFGLCFATEDQKEGMKAFIEKRKADFQGK